MILNNKNEITILVINYYTESKLLDTISKVLRANDYHLEIVNSIEEAENISEKSTPQAALLLCEDKSIENRIQRFNRCLPSCELIVITDKNSKIDITNLMKTKIHDYLSVDFSSDELIIKLDRALKQHFLKEELLTLKQQVAMSFGFDNIIGDSEKIRKVKETIKKIAPTDINIMITGEHGVGKNLIARVLHYHSNRRKNKLITVDLSIIPQDHITKELFGDPEDDNNCGILFAANGGTVLMKDIDKLPKDTQPHLLKFLEDFTLKTTQGETKIDIRVISTTTKNTKQLIDSGEFPEELFYKLSELPLRIPNLGDRLDDLEQLIDYFVRKLSTELNRETATINRSAYELLLKYNWPGNILELENTLKRAITLSRDNVIRGDDIILISSRGSVKTSPAFSKTILKRKGSLDENQRNLIVKALTGNRWNFTQTAQELGIGRTTLWRKVKKYNLKRETALAE